MIQPFTQLDDATEAALRASIQRFGVVVPIVVDGKGQILDGHHRSRIARELGITCPTVTRKVRDDEDATDLAYSLNADRRHLTPEVRAQIVANLRSQGHSLRSIAGAVGVSKSQVAKDVNQLSTGGQLTQPQKSKGLDGKERPAQKPKPAPQPETKADRDSREAEQRRLDRNIDFGKHLVGLASILGDGDRPIDDLIAGWVPEDSPAWMVEATRYVFTPDGMRNLASVIEKLAVKWEAAGV